MPALNWTVFENLPGAASANFEFLCRSIIRRHYGQLGDLRALANQPGVEFHLKLNAACDLGEPGRWYGWQCRWYDLKRGTDIGATRRQHIEDAIAKTERDLPGVTDWVLWTRRVLTRNDQTWFYALPTKMKLKLWSSAEVEDYLSGPALILREAYFGELVLTPELLRELHTNAVAPIRRRWLPEVHQIVDAERAIHRTLGEASAWSILQEIESQLGADIQAIEGLLGDFQDPVKTALEKAIQHAKETHSAVQQHRDLLDRGEYEALAEQQLGDVTATRAERALLRQLRGMRHQAALFVANAFADMQRAQSAIALLNRTIKARLIFVTADAGCGKTQMAAQLTADTPTRSAGLFLRGKYLSAGETLDDLAHHVAIHGKPVSTFESLIAAVDGAGQRQGKRLPIVIDGLNEAEDPRDWKDQLAPLNAVLARYVNVQVVCTLRSSFVDDALPEGSEPLEIPGFDQDVVDAVRRYFQYYKIDATDAELPWGLLSHPLTLRLFCDVTNPERRQPVGVGAIPGSLTVLFERYIGQVADRIAELSPPSHRYFPSDTHSALNKIGLALWASYSRDIELNELRSLLGDDARLWDDSLVSALEEDGILFREPGVGTSHGSMSIIYDALAGHIVADALLGEYPGDRFNEWLRDAKNVAALTTDVGPQFLGVSNIDRTVPRWLATLWRRGANFAYNRFIRPYRHKHHPLARDIFRALVGLTPHRMNRKQLWPLLNGQLQEEALFEAANMDGEFLDHETVTRLETLVRTPSLRHRDLLNRLFVTRAAQAHPLNANFLDSVLRPMSIADRDLRWTEWLRAKQAALTDDLKRLQTRWKDGRLRERDDTLRARWVMWTLTSTVRA